MSRLMKRGLMGVTFGQARAWGLHHLCERMYNAGYAVILCPAGRRQPRYVLRLFVA